ncbi:MAG: RHS repeat-associated core domain-containing protein, partial [Hyphomicrobium sp.]
MTTVRTRKPATGAWSNIATSIVYQPLSALVKSFTHGNGLATTNTHTLDYELSRCHLKDGALSLIDKSYTRSDKLNITSIVDGVAPSNSQSLWYNKSNRLQSAAGPWGNKTFYYDGTGNRTYEITTPSGGGSVTDTLGYPGGSNRLANVVTGTTTTRTFTHDGAGNITTDVRSGSAYTFTYNARGHLSTVSQDGNLKGSYQYNSLEQLASRTVSNSGPFNGTIHTTQDRSGNILAEADGTTGVVSREYIWLPGAGYAGTDLPVGVVDVAGTATPELLYVHADHLSRPIRLTDAAKVTAWAVEWLPWGGVHTITGSETLNARFPGQWFQVESGLHYNWHRHYDPTIGRYTQPDPLGFVDGPSVYAYARNAPGEVVDPF